MSWVADLLTVESAKRHRGYLAGVAAFVLFLAWITSTALGGVNWTVVLTGLAVTLAYLVIRESPLGTRGQETTTVALVVLGSLGIFGGLSDWNLTYMIFVTIHILAYALFALGLNLEYGFTGIINFGHVAFFSIGAYTSAILGERLLPGATEPYSLGMWGPVLVAAIALVILLIVATIGSVVAEARRAAPSMTLAERNRRNVITGAVAGGVAAVAFVLVVPWPLTTMWAKGLVLAGSAAFGMLLAAGFGVLLGLPTLRLREDYLAIVTIGAAEILRRFWLNETWLTEGPQGISPALPFRDAPQVWGWLGEVATFLELRDPWRILLLAAVVVALILVYALAEIIVRSPYGRVLKAIREDEEVAEALGKNVFVYKLQALALGSAVAALAGSLFAWHNQYINPNTFLPIVTFYAWVIIVLGGIGNNRGAVIGSFILWSIFFGTSFLDLAEKLGIGSASGAAFRVVLVGLLLMVIMMFKPEGILGSREEMALGD